MGIRSEINRTLWLASALVFVVLFSGCARRRAHLLPGVGSSPKTGSGLFLLDFDYETGQVTAVHVLKNAGSAILGSTSIKAFMKWRAKPRTVTHVKVPITYTMKNADS